MKSRIPSRALGLPVLGLRALGYLALSVALLTAAPRSQRTITVQGGGVALAQAIAAARPGDTLDVFPGLYRNVTVDKGLNIVFRAGAIIQADPGVGGMLVRDVPPGPPLALRGISFQGLPVVGPLRLENCSGTVVIDECDLASGLLGGSSFTLCTGPILLRGVFDRNGPSLGRLSFSRCADVSIVDCPLLPTLDVSASTVSIASSTIPSGNTTPMNLRSDSDVTLTDCRVEGPSNSSGQLAAVFLRDSSLTVSGQSVLVAGPTPSTPTGPVIVRTGGRIRLGPMAQLVTSTRPPIRGTGPTELLPLPATTAQVSQPGILEVRTEATPGWFSWTLLAAPSTPLRTEFGTLWFSPSAAALGSGVVPTSGVQTFRVPFPPQPYGAGVIAQTIVWDRGSTLLAGGATRLLLD